MGSAPVTGEALGESVMTSSGVTSLNSAPVSPRAFDMAAYPPEIRQAAGFRSANINPMGISQGKCSVLNELYKASKLSRSIKIICLKLLARGIPQNIS